MFIIKEYEDRYNKKINDFVISIYVDEYGFEEHRLGIEKEDNSIYAKKGGNFWIAVDEEDNIVGTIAVFKHNDDDIEIKRLYVRKDYRGKGLSKALYEKAFSACKENSFKKIFLGTYDKLETAIHFYLNRRIYRNRRNEGRKWC